MAELCTLANVIDSWPNLINVSEPAGVTNTKSAKFAAVMPSLT
jgi:hypothetical protein